MNATLEAPEAADRAGEGCREAGGVMDLDLDRDLETELSLAFFFCCFSIGGPAMDTADLAGDLDLDLDP